MRFLMRARLVAGLLLATYLGLFATPVMAEKTHSTPFKIGNMSANAVARTTTVSSLVDKLSTPPAPGFLSRLFFWRASSAKAVNRVRFRFFPFPHFYSQVEALTTNAQIHTKRVASVLEELETPNLEASLLLDILAAGDSSCPHKKQDNITRDLGNGNAGGKDTTSNLDSYSLGSCSDIYNLCFESCSVGKGLFKNNNKPTEGSCHVVCTVAQEGCQSCSKKQHKRSMIAILQGLVRVVSTAVYWMCYLLAVIGCCVGTIAWLVVGLFYSGPTMPLFSWAESWLPPAILVVIFNPFVVMGVIAWSLHRVWLDPSSVLLKLWQFVSNQAPFSAALLGWAVHVSYIRRRMGRLLQEVQRRSVFKVRQGRDVDGQVYIDLREAVPEETRRVRDTIARPNTRGRTHGNTTTDSTQVTTNENGGDIVNDSGNNIDSNADNDNKDVGDDNDTADNDTTDNDDNDNGNGNSNDNDNDTTDNDDDSSSGNNDNVNADQEDNDNNGGNTANANANEDDNDGDDTTSSTATTPTNVGANEDIEE